MRGTLAIMPKYKNTVQRSTATLHLYSIATRTMKKLILASTAVLALTVAHGQTITTTESLGGCVFQIYKYPDSTMLCSQGNPPNDPCNDTLYLLCPNDSFQLKMIYGCVPSGSCSNYQWKRYGINIPNATSNIYTVIDTGLYSLTFFNTYYSQNITLGTFVVMCSPTGINEYQYSFSFTIFPNPFSAETTLQTNNLLKNATLTVYNCFGQTVAQIKNISGQTVTLSRDNLASGLYFLRLTEENNIYTDKLVITDK